MCTRFMPSSKRMLQSNIILSYKYKHTKGVIIQTMDMKNEDIWFLHCRSRWQDYYYYY